MNFISDGRTICPILEEKGSKNVGILQCNAFLGKKLILNTNKSNDFTKHIYFMYRNIWNVAHQLYPCYEIEKLKYNQHNQGKDPPPLW